MKKISIKHQLKTKKAKLSYFLILMIFSFTISGSNRLKLEILNELPKNIHTSGVTNPIEYVWNYTWDLTSNDQGKSILIDQNDDIFVLGKTQPLLSAIYLSKFTKYCNQVWEVTWGESANISPKDMCIDNKGNIYVVADGNWKSYLVKFNGSGQYMWDISFDRGGSDHISSVEVDSSNHIYLAGAKDVDGTNIHDDIRIIKFFENGTQIWDKTWGDGNVASQRGYDLLIDENDYMFITGFDSSILDMILIKFDLDANPIWETSWGTVSTNWDIGWTVSDDEDGNLYVGVVLDRYGIPNASIVKFNPSGNYLWNVTWGGINYDYIYDIATNSKNEILCTGNTRSYGIGETDAFLLRISNQGVLLDNKTLGSSSFDSGYGVAVDSTDRIFITGFFVIGSRSNFFLARYEPLPIITINIPEPYQIFNEDAPDYSLAITEPNLDSMWYSINNGLNYTFTGTTGTINQSLWGGCEDGLVEIRFYANSTDGYLSSRYIEIQKDTQPPNITIISPFPNQLFGNKTLDFDLTIDELNLNSTWYTLNNGPKYNFTGTSGLIAQSAWDACENGSVIIKFYANDVSGYISQENVTVRKDTSFPVIFINSPLPLQLNNFNSPTFNLIITGQNIHSRWYSINEGLNYTFIGLTGTIDQTAWDACENGTVLIKFYANNTAGNTGYTEVEVLKDIIAPILTINEPFNFQISGNQSATFDITIIESNLNTTWYSLNNGLNYTFSSLTGVFDQTAWDLCPNGTLSIQFYANDTMGNMGNKSIIIYKDITPPIILIHSPLNSQVFSTYPPDYNISVLEHNIDAMWYSLNDGLNYSISGTSGKIDLTAWNLCGNGFVVIKFYTNDTIGNIGFSEVIVEKDAYFWDLTGTPIFIDDMNPNYNWNQTARDNLWCTGSGTWHDPYIIKNIIIDGQNSGSCIEIRNSNVYFRIENCNLFNADKGSNPLYNAAIKIIDVNNGTLYNNTCSNNNGRGMFVRFSNNNTFIENFASDNSEEGMDFKFCYLNNFLIRNSLINNGNDGLSLRYCHYHIIKENYVIGNVLAGLILWDSHNNTVFNNTVNENYEGIRLYQECNYNNVTYNSANDNDYDGIKLDNGEHNNIINNTVSNNLEHGINVFGDFNQINNNTAYLNGKSGIYVHDCNFTLISNNNLYNNTENGLILRASLVRCESHIVINNSIFNNQMNGILLMWSDKNNFSGNIIKYNQLNGIYLYSGSSDNLIYDNRIVYNNLNALDDGMSNHWNSSLVGNYWGDYSGKDTNDDGIGDSPYGINGTANSYDELPIWWDSPVLSIISPNFNDLFGGDTFSFEISIDEGISDTVWYLLNDSIKIYFTGTTGFINQPAWDMFGNGSITISFFVNDSRGYIAFEDVLVQKDIISPSIQIISPSQNGLFGNLTLYYELSINELNLDVVWFSINNSENYFILNTSGFMEQAIWDLWGNGTIILTFYANDTIGNEAFNEIIIRKDIFPPEWIIEPSDQFIEFGDDFYYNLEAFDISGISHWWLNDTILFVINDNGEISTPLLLSVGKNWLNIRVYDLATNFCNFTIKIAVQDTTPPIWVVEPEDRYIEYGNDFFYNLDASDLSGISYWWINDTINFQINDNGEITNLIALQAQEFSVEIRAYDPHDNYCSKSIKITVESSSNPPPSGGIPGYDWVIIMSLMSVISILFIYFKRKELFLF